MKEEIKHFTLGSKEENTYGWPWNEVVRKYLEAGYDSDNIECELKIRDKEYKVLRRASVTAFYDENGNTLFDVENERLKEEHERMTNVPEEAAVNPAEAGIDDMVPMGTASLADIIIGLPAPTEEEIKAAEAENSKSVKQRAKDKLEKELRDARDKSFAEPIIEYLLGRCEEDDGLSADVVQEHKIWVKCIDYICDKARKQAVNNRAAVPSSEVFEWAEDYYHLDDKALEEKKKKEEKERKEKQKQEAEKRAKQKEKQKTAEEKKPKKEPEPKQEKEVKKPVSKKNEPEGQMSLFDLI